ncbi:Isochorismatase-like protein [Lasiosphaeria miniovina]|uniref:Isochorismatase-like protein n=1 Tax=Lasiosphaeria miniovina TaxID=1954250 RepID=A0AA40DWB7_9PEZI|nr:Isochorismatase-like protein [Lasiosphaeria miniovina]KAK0718025.1 Isochorismatase-like protein [Lasiosphaeria miniovina]
MADTNSTAPDVVGNPDASFWRFSRSSGWDLTHTTSSPPAGQRLTLTTTTAPITIAAAKTALVVVDMQNLFLSPAMSSSSTPHTDTGTDTGTDTDADADTKLTPGLAAEAALLGTAFPAARAAGIRVVHVTWGLDEGSLAALPPVLHRVFGFRAIARGGDGEEFDEENGGIGPGGDLGSRILPDGTSVAAGRLLVRGQWNTALHGGFQDAFDESLQEAVPQVRFQKERLSGFFLGRDGDAGRGGGGPKDLVEFLDEEGITTLLFAGVNTDQCVLASLKDACDLGFDTVLLRDGCGTNSPDFARLMVEYNARRCWGFVSSCEALAAAVKAAEAAAAAAERARYGHAGLRLHEFVAVGRRATTITDTHLSHLPAVVLALQVRRGENGVVSRVNVAEIDEGAWIAARPAWKFVVLM